MGSLIARYCLPISIIASTFGMLLHEFLFGRYLLGELDTLGLVLLLILGLLPGLVLLPVFRRWNGSLFIAGNVAMFISGWCIILFFPNMGLPTYKDIGPYLGIYLGGAVLVVGTGIQYCILAERMEARKGLRIIFIVLGAIACLVILPYLKIVFGYTVYFTVSCLFSATNLLFFALAGDMRSEFVAADITAIVPASPGKKSIGSFVTLLVVVGSLLITQVTFYLGQDVLYAAERTVLVWPFAAAAAGVYAIVRIFTSKIFSPVALPGVALASVLLMLNVPSFVYSWEHAALVGVTYALALISFLESVPHWTPTNPRGVGPFFAFVGLFLAFGFSIVGYLGGIPTHTEEIPPILDIGVYIAGLLVLFGFIQLVCVYKMMQKEATP